VLTPDGAGSAMRAQLLAQSGGNIGESQ
jgi:hypothetical protein